MHTMCLYASSMYIGMWYSINNLDNRNMAWISKKKNLASPFGLCQFGELVKLNIVFIVAPHRRKPISIVFFHSRGFKSPLCSQKARALSTGIIHQYVSTRISLGRALITK